MTWLTVNPGRNPKLSFPGFPLPVTLAFAEGCQKLWSRDLKFFLLILSALQFYHDILGEGGLWVWCMCVPYFKFVFWKKWTKLFYCLKLIWLRVFENARGARKVILIVRFIFLSFVHINWTRWSNKGFVPLALIEFYLTKQNLSRKTKFLLENTVFMKFLRFQDLIWVGLRFSDRNPVHRNLLIKSFSDTSLSTIETGYQVNTFCWIIRVIIFLR